MLAAALLRSDRQRRTLLKFFRAVKRTSSVAARRPLTPSILQYFVPREKLVCILGKLNE